MSTDVRLDQGPDGTHLVLEGHAVHATGSDFMLDSPERRKGNKPFRRALVHDQSDGLTINFGGDYEGGVRIVGVAELVPRPEGLRMPTLVVRGGISYEERVAKIEGGATTVTFSLGEELSKLQTQISELKAKVAALEARP